MLRHLAAAEARGASLVKGSVDGLLHGPAGTVTGVHLDSGETIAGDAVVIAMGPWSVLASRWLSLPAVHGVKGHSLVFGPGAHKLDGALFLEVDDSRGTVLSPEIFPRADGTVWASYLGFPGGVARFDPKTKLTEYYEIPWNDPKNPDSGFSPRGMDIDSNGVSWLALASGHMASFDRKLCKGPMDGAKALTGQQCPEGWKLYKFPGPGMKGVTDDNSAEHAYYIWVDLFDTLGLGKDVPIAMANGGEALLALVDGKFVTLRVPYPLGFFPRSANGRVDDPKTGWKGKGLWASYSTYATWHIEGGKGEGGPGVLPKAVKFQMRPNPLAK